MKIICSSLVGLMIWDINKNMKMIKFYFIIVNHYLTAKIFLSIFHPKIEICSKIKILNFAPKKVMAVTSIKTISSLSTMATSKFLASLMGMVSMETKYQVSQWAQCLTISNIPKSSHPKISIISQHCPNQIKKS